MNKINEFFILPRKIAGRALNIDPKYINCNPKKILVCWYDSPNAALAKAVSGIQANNTARPMFMLSYLLNIKPLFSLIIFFHNL